ncbi:MAG: peptidyl-prolyl cis-trans isomerase [Phycisphaerae bacterium]|nr:peptidyl-prolyl cis-trans isomerase [Phycisphaerae bacterium]
MRNLIPILLLCLVAASLLPGCGSRRPQWMGGKRESDVIQPTRTAPAPQPTSAPGKDSTTSRPRRTKPPTSTVGDAPEASQTLSQTEPTLLGDETASRGDEPLSLTDLQSLGGDLPWAGAKPDTLSDTIRRDEPRESADGPKIEYHPRLAPLPEEQEIARLEKEQSLTPATTNEQRPEPAVPSGSPDDLRSRMTAPEDQAQPPAAKTDAQPPDFSSDEQEDVAVPEEPRKPFVEGKEEVVAGMTLQINDQNVSIDDVLAGLHKELAKIPKHVSRDEFRKQAAEIIAREMYFQARTVLMCAEAKRRLEDPVKDKIKEEMADTRRELIANAGGSVETLKEQFRREGTTLEEALKRHEQDITMRYYMQVKFAPAIVVNRRMLWNYYKKHKTDFVVEREVQMQIIAAPFRRFLPEGAPNPTNEELEVAKTQARQAIEKADADVKAGKDFGETAKTYSRGLRAKQGGVWPMMGAGNFRNTRVEKEAFTLPEGKYSDIIEGADGYYIVKAMKVKPGKITPFLDAQDTIETILRNEQYDKLSREYMNKLYKNAVIDSPTDFIPMAVERALERYKGKG